MRVGLLGGSFDPIHAGHVSGALAARRALELDEVLFLPTAEPPHKRDGCAAPAAARYAMVELSLLEQDSLLVSDFELTLGRPAYTIDTVTHFLAIRPRDTILLLLGADSFLDLANWVRWREILAAVEIGVMARPGWSLEASGGRVPAELEEGLERGRVRVIANPPHPASSTEIRGRLARGEQIPAGWLADPVLRYVRKYRLYR